MDPRFLLLICLLPLLVSCEYKLAENQNGKNVYRPDFQEAPIIGPTPHNLKYGNKTLTFEECGISYSYNDNMVKDIVDIYNDVAFGKGYKGRCSGNSSDKKIHVDINFKKLSSSYIPSGWDNGHEAYKLVVSEDGKVNITADYYPGVVRALDTLSQLIVQSKESETRFTIEYAPIEILDKPSFPYRGLMIDTGREFFFPDILKMTIDGMMLSRINVLHWHFAEDDSIAMFSESYKDLVNYTAFSSREVYTPDQVRSVVKYAKIRGVRVIPEMEGPSHLHILGFYPEFEGLVGCFRNYTNTASHHGGPPYAPVNPANELTYTFLEKYLNDLHKMFDSDYWHLGGDEVSIGCISRLDGTDEFLHEKGVQINDLQDYYIQREREILRKIDPNIKAGYWYRGEKQKYGEGDILQYWGGSGGIGREMDQHPNNYFVNSPSNTYYLDCGYINQYAGGSWCGSLHTWKEIMNYNPWSSVSESNRDRLLGGELPAWSEMNNEYNLPLKLFPRGAAMAFVHWNPFEPESNSSRIENLVKNYYRLKSYDVPSSRVTMRYCEEHLHHCFGK